MIYRHTHELIHRKHELKRELWLLEDTYGDNFPEPSEQLDRWNAVYDEYWELQNEIDRRRRERTF